MHTHVCGCLIHCTSLYGLNNRGSYHIRKYALYNCDPIAVRVKLHSHCILMQGLHYGTRVYWKTFQYNAYPPRAKQQSSCYYETNVLTNYIHIQWRIHIRGPPVLRITVITHGRQNVGDPPPFEEPRKVRYALF